MRIAAIERAIPEAVSDFASEARILASLAQPAVEPGDGCSGPRARSPRRLLQGRSRPGANALLDVRSPIGVHNCAVWMVVCGVNRHEGGIVATVAEVRIGRVYDEPQDDDGVRVLVDRIWPRGMTKERAALDEWRKDVGPSSELRKWYGHDPAKFEKFARLYRAELEQGEPARALQRLRDLAADRRLILLTASKAVDISEAAVLATILNRELKR